MIEIGMKIRSTMLSPKDAHVCRIVRIEPKHKVEPWHNVTMGGVLIRDLVLGNEWWENKSRLENEVKYRRVEVVEDLS